MKKVFLGFIVFACATSFAQTQKKLLIIGIDGCRSDAVTKEFSPVMDSLIHAKNTAYSYKIKNEFHTMSAPNWTSMLNGVHCFRHRTLRNNFAHRQPEKYPHFYKHLKDFDPKMKTVSLVNWIEINKYIVNGNADDAPLKELSADEVTDGMLKYLQKPEGEVPDASFVYYEDVDHAGHGSGFSPKNPKYTDALKNIDTKAGELLNAIQLRKEKYKNEDWLVMISTDHGGRKHKRVGGHAIGLFNPHIRKVFVIINGDDTQPGEIKKPRTVDIAYTALKFFNVPIKKEWRLQGKKIGLK